ncbi:MAG TPA: hypothetical protein VE860_27565 [Chthoniobacterales bacterium]|nr:hypothetical protein [Chthoniobacterales bacterium]
MSDTYEELRKCPHTEIEARQDDLTRRFNAIIEAQRARDNNGAIVTIIDGCVLELRRREPEDVTGAMVSIRKFGGFYRP